MRMKFLNRLKYALYILKRPFDGFWCLKSEKIGTIGSAFTLLALFFVTMVIRLYTTSYLVSTVDLIDFSIWMLLGLIVGVYILYSIANWSITTLLTGSGSFKDILISVAYSLTPITLVNIPLAILSQFVVNEEIAFLTFFNAVAIVYTAFLILASNMEIHEYTFLKSFCTVVLSIFAIVLIVVIAILFINLVQQVWTFILSIIKELSFRL